MGFLIFTLLVVVVIIAVKLIMSQKEPPTVTQMELAQKMYSTKPIDSEREYAKIEAMIQAEELGRDDVLKALQADTYTGELPQRRGDGGWTSIFDELRILSIAGINHRQGIDRYKGRNTIALVPEPTNEFDQQAIKVLAEDGHLLGYVQRNQTDMVRSWTRDTFPKYCIARIEAHEDEDDGHRFYTGYIYFKKL